VNTVINLRSPQSVGNLWTSWATISLSGRTLSNGVSFSWLISYFWGCLSWQVRLAGSADVGERERIYFCRQVRAADSHRECATIFKTKDHVTGLKQQKIWIYVVAVVFR
jgi:hypothetical protein